LRRPSFNETNERTKTEEKRRESEEDQLVVLRVIEGGRELTQYCLGERERCMGSDVDKTRGGKQQIKRRVDLESEKTHCRSRARARRLG